MSRPPAALLVFAVPLLLAGGAAGWRFSHATAEVADAPGDAPLPLPPVPPRIAEGADYERCLAMLPSDPAGAATMAEAWLPEGGGDAARHCLALATLESGETDRGARLLEALAGASDAPAAARAQVFDQAAQAWLVAGDPARAGRAADAAVALSPDDPNLLVDRAAAAMAGERYEPAMRDLGRALELDPSRDDALVQRGVAWRHLGRFDLARDDVERALSRDPEDAEALLERGILREQANDEAGARADWQQAITLEPDSDTADLAQQNLALLEAGPERR